MSAQKCRACGCSFEFIDGPGGKAIPVQKVRSVYVRVESADGVHLRKLDLSAHGGAFLVSHFETCSDPGRFSRG